MDKKNICIDTSLLIDYYRKKNKDKTKLVELSKRYKFSISVITKLEILVGITDEQKNYWESIFNKINIIPLNEAEIEKASEIIRQLKKQNKIIELSDILIAATSIVNNLELSTFNKKHFDRIDELNIID
jgi:predicted nucleic acid-binding protein